MEIYTYNRVSTDKQSSSTAQQDNVLVDFCTRNKFENVIHLADTDISGGKPLLSRPEGSKLKDLKAGDKIICAKHERLFRSLRDAVNMITDWFDLGVDIYLLNISDQPINMKNPSAKLQLYIMMAVAENELDVIRSRTKDNMKFRKENGRTYSSAAFGFDNIGERGNNGKIIDGKLVPNEAEQAVVKKIFELRKLGNSLGKIKRYLNTNNIPSKQGGKWHDKTVQCVLDYDLNKSIYLNSF
jgi:DNA invertase Pin-like site-specific DNA recombinase